MKHIRKSLLCLSAVTVVIAFQNCSDGMFNQAMNFSYVEPPICRSMGSSEVTPKLLYGWDHKNSSSSEYNQVMASPVVGDIDGDNIPEIIFTSYKGGAYTSDGVLRVLDGKTGKLKLSISDPAVHPFATTTPLIIDIDRDGKAEIVYAHASKNKIIALNHDGSLRWSLDANVGDCMAGFSAADLYGNGKADIIADKFIISEGENRSPSIKVTLNSLATACHTYAISLENKPSAPYYIIGNSGVFKTDGTPLWSFKNIGYASVADIRSDIPGLEVAVVGNSNFTIYNGLTGETISEKNLTEHSDLICSYQGVVGGGQATIGDFDGDSNTVEIAIATGKSLTIFNDRAEKIAGSDTQDCSSLVTGLTSFDFNGDKKPEIVYADEQYMRVYEMDGSKNLKVIWSTINPTGTLVEYPVVADVNGDGYAELVVVANDMWVETHLNYSEEEKELARGVTGLRVFGPTKNKSWMPTRPLWNQYAYFSSHVNDNLTATKSSYINYLVSTLFKRNIQPGLTELGCIKK